MMMQLRPLGGAWLPWLHSGPHCLLAQPGVSGPLVVFHHIPPWHAVLDNLAGQVVGIPVGTSFTMMNLE